VESRLRASEELLEHLPGLCEEFDRASWHEIAGVCALHLEDYTGAISHLEQALEVLPPQWILRQTTGLMPLVMAYASLHEREASLATAEKALPFVKAMNAPNMTRQFVSYTTCALKNAFPADVHMRHFIDDMQHQLLPQ